MTEDIIATPGKGLVYEDQIPLRWQRIDVPLTPARLAALDRQNEEMLAFIAVMEEHGGDMGDDEHDPHQHELLRVEHKLNLLLAMVGQLLARHADIPESVPVRLSPGAVEWHSGDVPAVGDRLQLELYVNNKYPNPLVFLGQVREVEPLDDTARIVVEFEPSSDVVTHALEKMIFRQHRRLVAQARKHQSMP